MDEGTLLDILINSSPLAGFAMYMVWQNKSMAKKMDEMNDKSENRSVALTERFEAREDSLRARYDVVISGLQQEKEAIKDDSQTTINTLAGKIDSLERQLQDVEKKFDQILLSIQQLSATVQELRFKDIARDSKNK
jgi:seryl-tRNA synthetase